MVGPSAAPTAHDLHPRSFIFYQEVATFKVLSYIEKHRSCERSVCPGAGAYC